MLVMSMTIRPGLSPPSDRYFVIELLPTDTKKWGGEGEFKLTLLPQQGPKTFCGRLRLRMLMAKRWNGKPCMQIWEGASLGKSRTGKALHGSFGAVIHKSFNCVYTYPQQILR